MFSSEIAYLVNKECHKDRLRKLEHQRLIQIAELQHSGNQRWLGKAANWVETQLVGWASKMQRTNLAHHHVLPRRR